MNSEKKPLEVYQKTLEDLLYQLHQCEGETIRASAKGRKHGYGSPEFESSLAKISRYRRKINKLITILKYEELGKEMDEVEETGLTLEQYLLKARLSKGYTKRQLARRSGVSHASVSTIEDGRYKSINTRTLGKVIRGMELTPSEAREALRLAVKAYLL